MQSSLIAHLADDLTFKVIRGLMSSAQPRHLRDLARDYRASPSGISDIVRRLRKAGVLEETREGNRLLFSLRIDPLEKECLEQFFKLYERQRILQRAQRKNARSERLLAKLEAMDEMYTFYRKAKRR
jgi:DNA-binding Lrp family transcriptional regulator